MKKNSLTKAILIAISIVAVSNTAFAMRLDPVDGTVVSPSAAEPLGNPYTLETDGTTVVWIDNRVPDGMECESTIYGAAITETGLGEEFLIDTSEQTAENVKVAGKWVAYMTHDMYNYSTKYIHLIDISDPASPFVYIVDAGTFDSSSFGLTEDILVFANYFYNGTDSISSVYVVDLTTLDGSTNYIGLKGSTPIYTADANVGIEDINLFGTVTVWSGYNQNTWSYYGSGCDLTGFNSSGYTANVQDIQFPGEGLYNMELDNDRTVFTSWFGMEGVFGLYGYTDPEEAEFQPVMLSENYESYLTGAIDLGASNVFALYETYNYNTNSQSVSIKGSTLAFENKSVVSMLREQAGDETSESSTPIADLATIPDGSVLYWTEYSSTLDEYEIRKANVVLECGDWGYNPADINHNCVVDLVDFSMMAAQWLNCTDPIDSSCQFGTLLDDPMEMPEPEQHQY